MKVAPMGSYICMLHSQLMNWEALGGVNLLEEVLEEVCHWKWTLKLPANPTAHSALSIQIKNGDLNCSCFMIYNP